MNVLFVVSNNKLRKLAEILVKEGHNVKGFLTSDVKNKNTINSVISKQDTNVIVLGDTRDFPLVEKCKEKGISIVGGDKWSKLVNSNGEYKDQLLGILDVDRTKVNTKFSINGWWNGIQFILPHHTYNYTHMMSGDLGIEMVSTGSIIKATTRESKYYGLLSKFSLLLMQNSYRGPVRVDVNEDMQVCDLQLGFKAFQLEAMFEVFRGSTMQVLLDCVNGSDKGGKLHDDYSIGVTFSVYPYPFNMYNEGGKIEGIEERAAKHIWWRDVSSGTVCGNDLGVCTAHGQTLRECRRRVYRTLSNVRIKYIQYRNDIGEGVNGKFNF